MGIEEVAVVEQCEIHAVERVERLVQVAVVAPAGRRDVAHDRFVFDAPQRDERHAHRVDDGGRTGYLAAVAFRVPRETAAGRVVAVVVKERRYGVVEVVEVAVGDADAGLGEGAADAGEEERGEEKRAEQKGRTFPGSVFLPGLGTELGG